MKDLATITNLIKELENKGFLTLKVSDDKLQILINRYLTGQNL